MRVSRSLPPPLTNMIHTIAERTENYLSNILCTITNSSSRHVFFRRAPSYDPITYLLAYYTLLPPVTCTFLFSVAWSPLSLLFTLWMAVCIL